MKNNKKGFTLIEMMVVIAIIAILVTVIMPTINNAVVKSRAATNAANLRTVESQLAVLRVQYPTKFETWASTLEEATPDVIENIFSGIFDFWFGDGASERLNQSFRTITSDANGTLRLQLSPDVEISAPLAKEIKIDGMTLEKNTRMKVYIGERDILVSYGNYNKEDFADIAEDGVYDGAREESGGSDGNGSCVTPDTLITLADGSKKRVDELTGDEMLLVWNLETGSYDSAPILFVDREESAEVEVIYLHFSDGSVVKVITEHGFWDYNVNKYVYLDRCADRYIGHSFFKQSDNGGEKVVLVDVKIEKETTTAWSPVTAGHLCYFVNDMLSMPGGIAGLFNIFEVNPETMTYDYESMMNDIETYGLLTYEELANIVPLSQEMFDAAGGAYLNISMGKGNLTEEKLTEMITRYSPYFG